MNSRAWCFTINSWTTDDCGFVADMALSSRYVVCGFEKGVKAQRDHIQGYVYFDNAKTLSRMKKYLPRAHLEISKGTPKDNLIYCSKEGDVWIYGELPTQGVVSREKLEDVMNNPYDNFHLYNQYRRAYTELKRVEKKTHERKFTLLDEKDLYTTVSMYDSTLIVNNSKLDTYTDEKVVFIRGEPNLYHEIVDWVNGAIPKIKRGYEIIPFDPEFVYIVYSSHTAYGRLLKLYNNYLTI